MKAAITEEEVAHVARLASLHLSREEKENYAEELSNIIDYMNHLRSVDTSMVNPDFHVFSSFLRMRDDRAAPPAGRDSLISNAPEQERGFFRVLPIFE